MMTLTINRRNHTIEMPTKKYATAASKYGTVEYNEVQAARRDYPNYNVVTRKAPKKADNLKGLTYEVMKDYISKHDENGEIKKQYDFLRGKSEDSVCSVSYGQIKKWFLDTYKDFGKFPENTTKENTISTTIAQ